MFSLDSTTAHVDHEAVLLFQSASGKVHHAVRHLRGQLDQAASRIRTLEAELKHGSKKPAEVNGSGDWAPVSV